MKHLKAALLLSLALLPACACAQRIGMEGAHVAFDYPESWLVVSPQLAQVYAPLLEDAGIDADALAEELETTGVQSRAYNADFSQWLSIVAWRDDLSEEIYDIESATDAQRRTMRTLAESSSLFETTGLRTQDAEWQREGGVYWLYIHYTKTRAGETIGRGIRYVTVRNGMYIALDWQLASGRFGNRDIASLRARLSDLTVTEQVEQPMRAVSLTADIPSETITSDLVITGRTEPGALLLAEAPDGRGEMQTLSVGEAGKGGSFSLLVPLEEEGSYDITLTASLEGMLDASVSGKVVYSAKTLPVSLTGVQDGGSLVVTQDSFTLSGQTLAGVQMQLVTPMGLTKKRAANDGTFSFELTTKDEGEHDYTLICTKDGYSQRRIRFTLVRQMTDDQERAAIKKSAEAISYKKLQQALPENNGKTLVITGPVTELSTAGEHTYLRMMYNKNADGTWYNPVIIVAGGETGVREGDMATLAVTVDGAYEEQDAQGNPVAVPRLNLIFVDKVQ